MKINTNNLIRLRYKRLPSALNTGEFGVAYSGGKNEKTNHQT